MHDSGTNFVIMESLQESAFTELVSPDRIKKAQDTYDKLAQTQAGQLQILKDAQNGNPVAADYLYSKYLLIAAKAFNKYYLGPDKIAARKKIANGDEATIAQDAYAMLMGASDNPKKYISPYAKFNPDLFSKDTDLIKQFSFYFYRYFQNHCIKAARKEARNGIAGGKSFGRSNANAKDVAGDDVPEDTPSNQVSFDAAYNDNYSTGEDFTKEIDVQETLKSFLSYLKTEVKNDMYYKLFARRCERPDESLEATAQVVGLSKNTARSYLRKIKALYIEFVSA